MRKGIIAGVILAGSVSACGGSDDIYCCTLRKMAGDTANITTDSDSRSAWSQAGNAKKEEACKTIVENELGYTIVETYIGQCANE